MNASPNRVAIIGGGFGGLSAARALRRAPVQVTLVDRRNFHLFQPLLYQVATGGLSPANIAYPLRAALKRQRNAHVVLAEVQGFDVANRRVQLADGAVEYDTLIVAAGVRHNYFGNDQWEPFAPGLKTIEDATSIRARILSSFEAAERATDHEAIAAQLTFVIVGAGPTGVELAGALAEIARHTLADEFRRINPADARIILVEALDSVLSAYPDDLRQKAAEFLRRLGVELRLRTRVTGLDATGVDLLRDGVTERIAARTVLWSAGVQGSPLAAGLSEQTGAALDRAGRIIVQSDCTLAGHPEIFVIGDLAACRGLDGKPLPGIAPVAMQQGRYVAKVIQSRVAGRPLPGPFAYRDNGSMATIGRAAAVANIWGLRFSGYLAWLTWLFVHLMFLIEYQNRVLVLLQWAWNYVTWGRSARLITEVHRRFGWTDDPRPPPRGAPDHD
ncbi:MAG: NAD(P)/FAD-dependent oxidoreductase [Phycisphaerae bacterium]